MTKIIGSIFDKGTGHKIEAKVNVLGAAGNFIAPSDAILKIGPGSPFFYSDGEFQGFLLTTSGCRERRQ